MDDIVNKIYTQNCGDTLIVLNKTENRNKNNKILYSCKFQKYPITLLFSKRDILRGSCINPEIERIEFIDKIWPQSCGDSLRILGKSNKKVKNQTSYLWECEFIKYPCKIYTSKDSIIKGKVLNPQAEQVEFVKKIWKQRCGDSLRIIKKSNIKEKGQPHYLWECEFITYPYKLSARKSHIIEGLVKNKNLPYFSKENLEKYIKENFKNKPTLEELSKKIKLSISGISQYINSYQLNYLISYSYKKTENSIFDILQERFYNVKIKQNKYFSENINKELDIYIQDFNLGIEFNGNYWHSSIQKKKEYHQEKSLLFKNLGIFVFHIFEYEWQAKQNILISIIASKLGIFDKIIGARKCIIKELDYRTYADFCNQNHLQGECGAKVKLGLFYKEELIQIMSFGAPRFSSDYDWEIIRECSKLGYNIIGGKEKLWSYFVKKYAPKNCISYCDFSKFNGNSYLKLGFKKERLNKPGFVWYDDKKQEIYLRTPWKNKEFQNLNKIYDCGQLVFIWNKV